jgi:hypothetical protein
MTALWEEAVHALKAAANTLENDHVIEFDRFP